MASPLLIIKASLFVKENWKVLLPVALFIMFFTILIFMTPLLLLFPLDTDSGIKDYQVVSNKSGIGFADMVLYDYIRYDNDYSLADPFDTAYEFLELDFEVIEERTEKQHISKVVNGVVRFKYTLPATNTNLFLTDTDFEDHPDSSSLIPLYEDVTLREIVDSGENITGKTEIIEAVNKYKTISNNIKAHKLLDIIDSLDNKKDYTFKYSYLPYDDYFNSYDLETQKRAFEVMQTFNAVFPMSDTVYNVVINKQLAHPSPTATDIDSLFGRRLHPVYKDYRIHLGIDFSNHKKDCFGSPVLSTYKGEVVAVNTTSKTAGWNIKVKHIIDGVESFSKYLHLSQIYVEVGDKVRTGEKIGAIGNTGLSTGAHLHFELYINNQIVDPYSYLFNEK